MRFLVSAAPAIRLPIGSGRPDPRTKQSGCAKGICATDQGHLAQTAGTKLESDLEFMQTVQPIRPALQISPQVKYGLDRVGSSQADDDPPFQFELTPP